MKVRTLLACLAAALSTLTMTLVGVTATAAPAAAADPSCSATPIAPSWYDSANSIPQSEGHMYCTVKMNWVRVDLQMARYNSQAGWVVISTGYHAEFNSNFAYHRIFGECKGTGIGSFATKAKGSAKFLFGSGTPNVGVGTRDFNDPADGGSYWWSGSRQLGCGSPPPPPDTSELCNVSDAKNSVQNVAARRTSSTDGGGIPIIC